MSGPRAAAATAWTREYPIEPLRERCVHVLGRPAVGVVDGGKQGWFMPCFRLCPRV